MRRYFLWGSLVAALFWITPPSFSEEATEPKETIPVVREAVKIKEDIVAVDLSLAGEVLEAQVTGFMEQERPKLSNVLLVGPGVGRLSPTTRRTVRAGLDTEPPYPTRRSGFLVLHQGSEREAKGTLTREHLQFILPLQKMRETIEKKGGKAHYEFWVLLESATRGGKIIRFKFDLDKLPELILASG